MLKNVSPILKTFLLVILVLGLSIVAYSFYNDYFYNRGILPIGIPPREELLNDISSDRESIKAFHAFQQKFKLMSSDSTSWSNWDWRSDLFIAKVTEIDQLNKTMGLSFKAPKILGFPTSLVSKVSCPIKETMKLDDELFPEVSGIEIFKEIEVNDTLYAYCLNELCTEIGKVCLFRNF